VFAVTGLNVGLLVLFVGVPVALTAIWIAGFVVSAVISPFIAAYEDLFGYNRHHGAAHG
jgi:hypothetical protein